jgi:hypothetical protein
VEDLGEQGVGGKNDNSPAVLDGVVFMLCDWIHRHLSGLCGGARDCGDSQEDGMMRNASTPTGTVGERVELARYVVCGVERVLYSQLIDGVIRVTDRPADGPGRAFLVDRCFERDGRTSIEALVADYTRQAERLEEIPMLASETILERIDEVELARYRYTGGERVLYGQRVNGVVRVTDRPAEGSGRSYLVELGIESDGYPALEALIADYTSQAQRLDEIPMAAPLAPPAACAALEQPAGPPRARVRATRCWTAAAAALI